MMQEEQTNESSSFYSNAMSAGKILVASALLLNAASSTGVNPFAFASASDAGDVITDHRRLSTADGSVPTYIEPLIKDLEERTKLMEDTPPEEVKYWFEYTGPLQKYFYRYSNTRGKADYFEGRDDSGVVSSRFVEEAGGGAAFKDFFQNAGDIPSDEIPAHTRMLDNCLAMGSSSRPNLKKGTSWYDWFGGSATDESAAMDRCRVLIALNMVGAGKGTTMLWETRPPTPNSAEPKPWVSEQATAATHLERNLKEIDAMCATGQIAARVQVLVCEPIPGVWTDWMDSMLPNCGGKPAPIPSAGAEDPYESGADVEDRPSPVQIVVVAGASTADSCHDMKSGFMEKRMQDLILAPPYLSGDGEKKNLKGDVDPTIKTTHPDLVSSDDHDLYIAMKWTSLVTVRSVSAFLQASADLAAAAASPKNQGTAALEKNADGVTVAVNDSPSSPFLIPSFIRVSYVSEENNKVAKWRMHGDFFHPAAWEVCKDSFDMAWIPDSLSGTGGVNGVCYGSDPSATTRKLFGEKEECGQWWVYMAEEQMPTTPEIHANEVTHPVVQGGSNYIWMLTERQRKEVVKLDTCEHNAGKDNEKLHACGEFPQAVIPLGDLESFMINFTPNTALGKKHNAGRRPGYSREQEHELDREKVRDRKQLKGQEDIEKALFDYTVYPAALFHKDATLKAARTRDAVLTKSADEQQLGPQTVKSGYYDVTITKPRQPIPSWCQAIARKGLCALYSEYFRQGTDERCLEACGMKKDWSHV
eukprot:CAMPEP_0185733108 /NCGR_PEP_ID=MMETSP1171-20130828/18404_1 /TAXON_ID=374046 /ORGANISM="Helicotheca tamensis, Strain CCMP826" /LENGTH=756 /DNA_ID=CAMNT_0028402743 /DNA_START=12 /DNA_END=2282 /DNA_ORIENTATION=+